MGANGTDPTNPEAGVNFVTKPNTNGIANGSGVAAGDSTVVATNLQTFTPASTSPDANKVFSLTSPYTVTMQLTTLEPGVTNNTKQLTFTGQFSGTFSSGFARLGNTWVLGEQTVTLGSNVFDVKALTPTLPGPPGSGSLGSIDFYVSVNGTGGAAQVPEPSTLLLSFLGGVSVLGGALRRRRVPV